MERKIGEIFDGGDGHFYKCVEQNGCHTCSFDKNKCYEIKNIRGDCARTERDDGHSVVFILADVKPVDVTYSTPRRGSDPVTHPSHYTSVVPGIECIQVTQHFNFNRGNAIKYLWRAGEKDKAKEIEDLEKARKYIDFEIARVQAASRDV